MGQRWDRARGSGLPSIRLQIASQRAPAAPWKAIGGIDPSPLVRLAVLPGIRLGPVGVSRKTPSPTSPFPACPPGDFYKPTKKRLSFRVPALSGATQGSEE